MITSTLIAIVISTADVKAEIIKQATNSKVDVKTALDIAFCESSYRANAKNPKGTATGIYQFTEGTWKWIKAEGERTDYKQNIKYFMKYFKKFPRWWKECNK